MNGLFIYDLLDAVEDHQFGQPSEGMVQHHFSLSPIVQDYIQATHTNIINIYLISSCTCYYFFYNAYCEVKDALAKIIVNYSSS